MLDDKDTRAGLFIYGRYDFDKHRFRFEKQVVEQLTGLHVGSMGRCQHCFARWNCGGDCIAKIALGGIDNILAEQPVDRCAANRALTADQLILQVLNGDENTDNRAVPTPETEETRPMI